MTKLTSAHSNRPSVARRHTRAFPGKRAANLTLNDGSLLQAKSYTANLSAKVAALLTGSMAEMQCARATHRQLANGWCADWNAAYSSVGSIADEHSTL